MATPKKKSTTVHTIQAHHKSDVRVHLLMGSAIGLLLFVSAAQFLMTQMIWESAQVNVQTAEIQDEVSDTPQAKQVVIPVSTDYYRAWIPQNFSFRVSADYSVISTEDAYAVLYLDGTQAPAYWGPQINPYTLEGENITPTSGLLDPAVSPVRSQIWVAPGVSPQSESVSQLKSVVDAIELIPFSM